MGAKTVPREYAAEACGPHALGRDARAWAVTGGTRPYRVAEGPDGWRCTCDAFKWGHGHPCRHIKFIKGEPMAEKTAAPKKEATPRAETPKAAKEPARDAAWLAWALADPFAPHEVKWLPKNVTGGRCLAIAYINARAVMDRLDAVVGVGGWEDAYDVLPGGKEVRCRLTVTVPGVGRVTKEDVGGESEQPDQGDKTKAAFSDALKRAAVKFGIGRYLYHLPKSWADYDAQKRQITRPPELPKWARPGGTPPPEPEPEPPDEAPPEAPPAGVNPDRVVTQAPPKPAPQANVAPKSASLARGVKLIAEANSLEALEGVGERIKKAVITDEEKATLRKVYGERMAALLAEGGAA